MAKLDGKKLLACCANGAGSSLMMENAIKKVMTKYGIKPAELRHCPVSEGKTASRNYDVVFCARTLQNLRRSGEERHNPDSSEKRNVCTGDRGGSERSRSAGLMHIQEPLTTMW